jgi:hypothetical protein
MGQFVIVTGIGHAATKWLVMVLNRPKQGIRFEHEPLMRVSQPDWTAARAAELRGAEDPFFVRYWPHVEQNLSRHHTYGDAMSWNPVALQMINEQIKIDRVIFLVRHGVPQLHSIWNASLWNRRDRPTDWLYSEYLKRYWILAGKPGNTWKKWSRWQKICLWWNTNVFMPDIVRKWLPDAKVEVKRTEDLTGSVKELNHLCKSLGLTLGGPQLRELQGQDVNRKVEGNRAPAHLWRQWSEEQKADFIRVCGSGIEKLGYRMP